MKNQAAIQLGRLGGKVSTETKAAAAKRNASRAALVKSGEARVRCNVGHSGNHSLTYDVGYFQCAGCGHFHAPEAVEAALAGPVEDWTGAGGVVRSK